MRKTDFPISPVFSVALVRQDRNHMGTTFSFLVSCEQRDAGRVDRLLARSHGEVSRLEAELSEFLPESPVYRLNHAPVGERVRFTRDGILLLERAIRIRELTAGHFDPEAKSRRASRDPSGLEFRAETREVWRLQEGTWLGFGAIGKGYALDRVRELLEREGFRDFVLDAGGSSLVISGYRSPGEPWHWGWSWTRDEEGNPLGVPLSHPRGTPVSIGVSGIQEKGFHLLDPRTGAPSDRMISALVATSSATDADALSTSLFVGGWDDSRERLSALTLSPAMACLESSGEFRWNGVFQNWWGALAGIAVFSLGTIASAGEDSIDLASLGASSFTPYLFERNPAWALLPLLSLAMVILHLKKTKGRSR